MIEITFSADAVKELDKLDSKTRDRVFKYIDEVSALKNPREIGEPLKSNLKGLWRYRVGDYRVICDIQDNELVMLILRIAHRSKVYK